MLGIKDTWYKLPQCVIIKIFGFGNVRERRNLLVMNKREKKSTSYEQLTIFLIMIM